MEEKSIELSPKYGLNPSLVVCPICGEDTNEIALLGKLQDDAEAPRRIVGATLCKKCQAEADKGNKFILEVKDNPVDKHNPERTGRYIIVNGEAVLNHKETVLYCEQSDFEQLIKRGEELNG